jgi:hypothetical protein
MVAEEKAGASVVDRPSFVVGRVRVGPDQVAHGSGLRDIVEALDGCDLI